MINAEAQKIQRRGAEGAEFYEVFSAALLLSDSALTFFRHPQERK